MTKTLSTLWIMSVCLQDCCPHVNVDNSPHVNVDNSQRNVQSLNVVLDI